MKLLPQLLALLCVPGVAPAAGEPKEYGEVVRPFLNDHCFDCHGEDAKKERVRLDRLPVAFETRDQAETWTKVWEKLQSGAMPPKKRPRPPEPEQRKVEDWIEGRLVAAEENRQRIEGRVVARRLNRAEYQNTVRDLLDIHLELKSLLPEDNAAGGFDNIGDALTVSPVLMERYLEAAEAALHAALDEAPLPSTTQKLTYKDDPQITKNTRYLRELDDGVVFFAGSYQPTVLRNFHAVGPGLYRFRISAYGFQSTDPVTMGVYAGSLHNAKSQDSHLVGFYDMPSGNPRVVEFTERLAAKNDTIKIEAMGGKRGGGLKLGEPGDAYKYDGPGLAVKSVEIEGPLPENHQPGNFRQFLETFDLDHGSMVDAEKIFAEFASRAFRHPVKVDELGPIRELAAQQLAAGRSFRQALRLGLEAVLCSPRFLYLQEKPGRLDSYAVASRLSYFLWSSMPDAVLLRLAREQKLSDPQTLRAQVERMLQDPKAQRFVENFLGQWLDLRLIDFTTPDKRQYEKFNDLLKDSMVKETRLFFEEILRNDLDVATFVGSDFTFLNESLARHYGIPGVKGQEELRKVSLSPGSHRGGVLTQASVLKVTANGTATSPVLRGVWVLRKIVGQPPPPPPKDVPALEPDIRGATTIREQLEKHRQSSSCAACHARIDPFGFPLENFDVIGGWRENYTVGEPVLVDGQPRGMRYHKGATIDATCTLPTGEAIHNIDELKSLLCQNKEQIANALAGQLVTYATGGVIHAADRSAVAAIVAKLGPERYGLRSMIQEIVQSPLFLCK